MRAAAATPDRPRGGPRFANGMNRVRFGGSSGPPTSLLLPAGTESSVQLCTRTPPRNGPHRMRRTCGSPADPRSLAVPRLARNRVPLGGENQIARRTVRTRHAATVGRKSTRPDPFDSGTGCYLDNGPGPHAPARQTRCVVFPHAAFRRVPPENRGETRPTYATSCPHCSGVTPSRKYTCGNLYHFEKPRAWIRAMHNRSNWTSQRGQITAIHSLNEWNTCTKLSARLACAKVFCDAVRPTLRRERSLRIPPLQFSAGGGEVPVEKVSKSGGTGILRQVINNLASQGQEDDSHFSLLQDPVK